MACRRHFEHGIDHNCFAYRTQTTSAKFKFNSNTHNVLESLFVELGPNKIAEGLSDLDHFFKADIIGSKERDLIIDGYLRKLDAEADLEKIAEVEDKLIFVRLLRERELINEDKFAQLKTKILEAI